MAVRRTLKQKQQTHQKHEQVTYELPKSMSGDSRTYKSESSISQSRMSPTVRTASLFGYPLSLIYGDIMRTLVAAIFILGLLLFLKVYYFK